MKFQWTFDDKSQQLRSPSGWHVTVREIAQWLQDQIHGHADLTGEWTGWHIRGRYLKGPGKLCLTRQQLTQLAKTLEADEEISH